MKKILLLLLCFFSLNIFAQFPQYRLLTNQLTRTEVGALHAPMGIINGVYTDTTAANAGYIEFYNGAQIWTRSDRNFWLRDSVGNKWVRIAKYTEVGAIDTTGQFIWAQDNFDQMTHQTKNAWFDTLKLRRLSIANEDSAHFDWWWKGDNDDSWTYFNGKNLWVSDNDTVNAANDSWPYSVNNNATFQRVTRLNPSLAVGYRFNLMANQVFTNGNTAAGMAMIGGDGGASIYAKTMLKENPEASGRILINGGTPFFNATPVSVAILEVDGGINGSDAHVNATGYWAGYNSMIIIPNPDSLEHFIHYLTGSYLINGFNRNLKTETGFYIDYGGAPSASGFTKWGIYAPDATSDSYNLLSRLGVGTYGFGSHETPAFHSSAALQINDTTKSFIPSRWTTTQMNAVASPDTALFFWNTDSLRFFGYKPGVGFKGIAWTDEAIGGGGGSNPGLQYQAAYYATAGSTVDDWAGVKFGQTGINTEIIQQATTDVALKITLAASSAEDAMRIVNSGGTTLAKFTKDGKLVLPAGFSTTPTLLVGGAGISESDGGYGLLISTAASSYAGKPFYGGYQSSVDASNNSGFYISTDLANGVHRDAWINKADGTWQIGWRQAATGAGKSEIMVGFPAAGTNENGGDLTFRPAAGTGNNTTGGSFIIETPDATGSGTTVQSFTEKFRVTRTGVVKIANYGSGTFTGTIAKMLAVESDGDVIEKNQISLTKGMVVELPSGSENLGFGWKTPVAITITSVNAVLVGSSTPSVTMNVAFGSDRTSGTNVFTAGQTVTSTTTGHTFNSGFNDQTIPAGSFIWFTTSAQSGTVTQIEVTINYTED